MRECKFRVWDKKLKDMRYQDLQELCLGDIWFDGVWDTWCVINDANDKQERFILMQYTGLKDKNGKEIYEGDIIKVRRFMESDYVTTVEYRDGMYWHLFETEDYEIVSVAYRCEVIGNKYENPELLGV
jgi:uncharacterized phage protein (TIGR01671 family)